MDLHQIRYFLAIAAARSFTKAADHLYVSQPSLSAGIKKLEKELGVSLFERGGRRVLLTPAGQIFQKRAKAILAEYRSARQDLEKFKDMPTLHIATLHSMRCSNLVEIMGAFRQQYPSIAIEICSGHLSELQDWLDTGEVDVAITWIQDTDEPKNSQFLFYQPISLAVPCNHPFTAQKSVSLAELKYQPYIARTNCEFWRTYPKLFESAGVEPHIVYSSNNEEWVISLIQAGMGISIMPVWKNVEGIVYVPIIDWSLSRTVGLRWRSQQKLDTVQWFRQFAQDYLWEVTPEA